MYSKTRFVTAGLVLGLLCHGSVVAQQPAAEQPATAPDLDNATDQDEGPGNDQNQDQQPEQPQPKKETVTKKQKKSATAQSHSPTLTSFGVRGGLQISF